MSIKDKPKRKSLSRARIKELLEIEAAHKPKKLGRPATGKDPMMGFRAPPELRDAVDKWRKRQPGRPSLAEAIRQLLERGLGRRR
jgi:hypothetical protein